MRPIHPIVSTPASSFRSAAIVVALALVGGCAVEDEIDLFECGFSNCQRNFARRIDNAFSDFIAQVSWDY